MRLAFQIFTFIILSTLWSGCVEEDKASLIRGEWKIVKVFINDNDVTQECNLETIVTIADDLTLVFPLGCYSQSTSPLKMNYNAVFGGEKDVMSIFINNQELFVEITLVTRTEIEVSRRDSNFEYRYALQKVED